MLHTLRMVQFLMQGWFLMEPSPSMWAGIDTETGGWRKNLKTREVFGKLCCWIFSQVQFLQQSSIGSTILLPSATFWSKDLYQAALIWHRFILHNEGLQTELTLQKERKFLCQLKIVEQIARLIKFHNIIRLSTSFSLREWLFGNWANEMEYVEEYSDWQGLWADLEGGISEYRKVPSCHKQEQTI